DGESEFILFVDRCDWAEEAAGVELRVPEEFMGVPVELIGAGLQNVALFAAAGVAVLGVVAAGRYRQLLHRINRPDGIAAIGVDFNRDGGSAILLIFLAAKLAAVDTVLHFVGVWRCARCGPARD